MPATSFVATIDDRREYERPISAMSASIAAEEFAEWYCRLMADWKGPLKIQVRRFNSEDWQYFNVEIVSRPVFIATPHEARP